MPDVQISPLGVALATLASMMIGGLWYSPVLFEKVWLKALGKKKEDITGAGKSMAIMLFVALLTAYVMAHFADYVHARTASQGAQLGFWLWLGFVATTSFITTTFENRSRTLYLIFVVYQLVSFLAMGMILAIFT